MIDGSSDWVRTYCCLLVRKSSTNNCNLAGTLYSARLSMVIDVVECNYRPLTCRQNKHAEKNNKFVVEIIIKHKNAHWGGKFLLFSSLNSEIKH